MSKRRRNHQQGPRHGLIEPRPVSFELWTEFADNVDRERRFWQDLVESDRAGEELLVEVPAGWEEQS
jgi:hypothetical protein